MISTSENITQLHLKSLGLSDYLVKQVVKRLDVSQTINGFKAYSISDVKKEIETKLSNTKIKPQTREKLQRVLAWLEGRSNVIEVDFLKRLPPEKRIEVLNGRLEQLDEQERLIIQQTTELVQKAKKMASQK